MPRITSAIGFVLGTFVGVGAMLATARLDAGQAGQPAATRLIEIQAPRGQSRTEGIGPTRHVIQPPPGLVFFKDVKSDGCWLAALGSVNEAIALAAAPAAACQ